MMSTLLEILKKLLKYYNSKRNITKTWTKKCGKNSSLLPSFVM